MRALKFTSEDSPIDDEEKVEFVKGNPRRITFRNALDTGEYCVKISTLINGKTIASKTQSLKPKTA